LEAIDMLGETIDRPSPGASRLPVPARERKDVRVRGNAVFSRLTV